MNGRKFFGLLGTLFLIVLIIYLLTTPKGNAYPLIGVVDGNERSSARKRRGGL